MSSSSLRVWRWHDDVAPLRAHFADGGVAAIPTESSYGLAAHPLSSSGVERIYRIKERDRGKPLPVVVANLDQALALGIDPDDPLLARVAPHWPAALTAIVTLRSGAEVAAAAGGRSLAVRVPAHPELQQLLEQLGHGLTATSANRSGEDPILETSALGRLFAQKREGASPGNLDQADEVWLVDGGDLPGGAPSTMLSFRAGRVVVARAGAYDWH